MHCISKCIEPSFSHGKKYRNFTSFLGVETLWNGTVSSEVRAIHPKPYGNCAFSQNFHTKNLGEILVFYAVSVKVAGWMVSIIATLWHIWKFYRCDTHRLLQTLSKWSYYQDDHYQDDPRKSKNKLGNLA